MNIAFFLTPKSDVICENLSSSLRSTVEKMEKHKHASIPVIDDEGKYVGTITEGDLLVKFKELENITFMDSHLIKLVDVNRRRNYSSVSINQDIEDLLDLAATQNFVPVVDDAGIFIGIIKRSAIINYFIENMKIEKEKFLREKFWEEKYILETV